MVEMGEISHSYLWNQCAFQNSFQKLPNITIVWHGDPSENLRTNLSMTDERVLRQQTLNS